MPELTVSMPAYNSQKYVKQAIESVLRQEGVDFELIVVDDGSTDDTAAVVESFKDRRLTLIRNTKNRGIAYCHNLVIDRSHSPFIAHVDSDDLVLAGAFQKLLAALQSSPTIGQAHCYFFDIDEHGRITRKAFRQRREVFRKTRPVHMDYKRELLVHGSVMNALRTYRREVFDTLGGFNERLRYGEDYEMALRMIDKYDIKLVPEFLYCRRIHHSNTVESMRLQRIRFWGQRLMLCHTLARNRKIQFPTQTKYKMHRLMMVGLLHVLRLARILDFLRGIVTFPSKARAFLAAEIFLPLFDSIYTLAHSRCSWRPLSLSDHKTRVRPGGRERVAYYLWHYPVLSQTFIQRELWALSELGLSVTVVADASEEVEALDLTGRPFAANTHYLFPMEKTLWRNYLRYFLARKPLLFASLFVYLLFRQHRKYKTLKGDLRLFQKATYLAGVLKDKGVTRIHSPWADECALVALMAARLLGVPYSVQARAHDLYRIGHFYPLPEKFTNANFVITNCRYNESHIRSILNGSPWPKVHTIYEGIDPRQFKPQPKRLTRSNHTRILSVARLIEEKGLVHLLKACRILKERGFVFTCEIIGGPEKPLYMNYYVTLKRLHRHLQLEECVFFLGAQPFSKVLEAYQHADIFVLPCVVTENGGRDTTPNSLIEAMAMELPVISTNITGIPEIVEDDVSGILISPGDEKALAEAIIRLTEDATMRKKLGENARRRVEERFDIYKNADKYVELFAGPSVGFPPPRFSTHRPL